MIKDKIFEETFENVCCFCSELFITTDEEMCVCPKCWQKYLEKQFSKPADIQLTKELLGAATSNLVEEKL